MKRNLLIAISMLFACAPAFAQRANALISSGNKLYRENVFDKSVAEYNKALAEAPKNPIATYNLGNAHFRSNHLEDAVKSYDATIENSVKKPEREKAYYNKGVAFSKEQKIAESIDAWKQALKLDGTDKEARENLQKALMEQKKQQQQKENQPKDEKDKKKENQKQDKQKQQQPQEQQSKLTKKQVEQLLKALAQKEKEVQQKMQSKNASPSSQDKDW